MAKCSVQLVISVLTNTTRIQNNNISLVIGLDTLHAIGFKQA